MDSLEETWNVCFSSRAARQKRKLPENISEILARLIGDIEKNGPIQKDWPHFGSLKKGKLIPDNAYHCHIKNGRPTYVVCWKLVDKTIKIVEIFYAGSHENAPY